MSVAAGKMRTMPIEPPTDERREELAADLRDRAGLVREHGWDPYENVWSSGEVAAVRLLLGDTGAATETYAVWAPTLWGIATGEDDARGGYHWTRGWFEQLAGVQLPCGWPPIDPDDGWAAILTVLRDDLERIDPGLVVRQVKQKFGVLRVHVDVSAPELEAAVRERIAVAGRRSAETCERCGRPGRIQQKASGWYQALCEEHASQAAMDTEEEEPVTDTDLTAEYPPPTTVAELRRLLDQLPPDMPVLVDAYEAAYAAIDNAVLVEVQELTGRPSYLGRFEHVGEAERAVAGDDAAGWALDDPKRLPKRVGAPVVALVLRREEREDDEGDR